MTPTDSSDPERLPGLWRTFWDNYRRGEVTTEADLFFQAGKTVNKEPIGPAVFRRMIDEIVEKLQLTVDDCLVDFCCGNGLVSRELAPHVKHVTGVDFSEHLISSARQFKASENTHYVMSDVTAPIHSLVGGSSFPGKYLMNDALAYFEPDDLGRLLKNILQYLQGRPFRFLLTTIPNAHLKWNFYNTPERVARHRENESRPGNTNDGLGRWWKPEEIEQVCSNLGLPVEITNQPPDMSNYRMDAVITSIDEVLA